MINENVTKLFVYIDFLESQEMYKECVQQFWKHIRNEVFSYLFDNNIEYDSTEKAILNYMKNDKLKNDASILHYLYCLNILCGWDNNFSFEYKDYVKSKEMILNAFNF